MIDRYRIIFDKPITRIILLGGAASSFALATWLYTSTAEQEVSDTDIAAIEAEIGRVTTSLDDLEVSDDSDRKRPVEHKQEDAKEDTEEETKVETPEIEAYSYDLSPIVSIDIAGVIKEESLISYDWQSNIDNNGNVVYDPRGNFSDMFVSVENYDPNDDDAIEEYRGRLGLEKGSLVGTVFAFGHTNSSPEDDAIMDKVDEVKLGAIVKATTENGAVYVFEVEDILLADKEDPDDEAKLCGEDGRIFTCLVRNNSRTDKATYLCLVFKGIELEDRTILAKPQ